MHENHVAHQYVAIALTFPFLIWPTLGSTYANIMLDPSNMFPESFHLGRIDRSKDFRRKVKSYLRTRHPTRHSLTLVCPVDMTQPMGHPSTYPSRVVTSRPPEHEDGMTPCNPSPIDVYHLGNLIQEYTCRFVRCSLLTSALTDGSRNIKGLSSWST